MEDQNNNAAVQRPILALPSPVIPPPLIARLRNEATEPSQVPGSQIWFYFGQSHVIGTGGNCYGVFKGYHEVPEKKAAVKLIEWHEGETSTNELEIWNELRSNEHPGSKYIVELYEYRLGSIMVGDTPKPMLFICMELATGSLEQETEYATNYSQNLPKFHNYLQNIFSGLQFLHDNNIIHRDIKPHNVLLFKNETTGESIAKLSDFGLSRMISQSQGSISYATGTEIWMSPEQLVALQNDEEFFNTKAMDIFSLGLVSYFILSRRSHAFRQNDKLLVNIRDDKITPDFRDTKYIPHSDSAEHLLWWMLKKDPSRRPTIHQCRAHPYMWENLEEKLLEFYYDIEHYLYPYDDPDASEEKIKAYREIVEGVSHAVTRFFDLRQYHSRLSFENGTNWNWEAKLDTILTLPRSDAKTIPKWNGFSAHSLVHFINAKVKDPGTFYEGAVARFFSEDGSDESFSRKKFADYFLRKWPEMHFMFFFVFARITPQYPHLQQFEDKYFKEFVGQYDFWNHGLITGCLENLSKKMNVK